jgi:hypothetical protein
VDYESDGYDAIKDSFIFSIKDGIENYILSRVKNKCHAISNSINYGPSFGDILLSVEKAVIV